MLHEGLQKYDQERYAETLYKVSLSQQMLFESNSPNLFKTLVDLVKLSVQINFKTALPKTPISEQEQIDLIRTSLDTVKIDESGLKTLYWVAKTIDVIQSEYYFLSKQQDSYILLYYYLIINHYQEIINQVSKYEEQLGNYAKFVLEHVKNTVKNMLSSFEFVNFFIGNIENIKFIIFLSTVFFSMTIK